MQRTTTAHPTRGGRAKVGPLRIALATGCFLLLGAALGFLHRTRHLAALDGKVPMERAMVSLEALALLRQGQQEEATEVLYRYLDRTVRAIRREPTTPVGRFVLEQAVPVLEGGRRLRDRADRAAAPGEGP